MDTDDVIRDLAKAQGASDLDNTQVHEIRQQLSNAYVDDVLDGRFAQPAPTGGSQDGEAQRRGR